MSRLRFACAAALIAALATGAAAQVDLGTGLGPDAFGFGVAAPKKETRPPIPPLAFAASLAFNATTWTLIQASTAPARDIAALMNKGYYRLELFQILIMAMRTGTPLRVLTAEREKGDRLRAMADRRHLDYDQVYDQSLEMDRDVEGRLLPEVLTISVSTVPPAALSTPPRRRGRPRPR